MTTKLNLLMNFEQNIEEISEPFLANVLNFAVTSMYGQIGGAQLQYSILAIDTKNMRLTIEAYKEDASKIWAAMSLLGYYSSSRIRVKVSSEEMKPEITEIII